MNNINPQNVRVMLNELMEAVDDFHTFIENDKELKASVSAYEADLNKYIYTLFVDILGPKMISKLSIAARSNRITTKLLVEVMGKVICCDAKDIVTTLENIQNINDVLEILTYRHFGTVDFHNPRWLINPLGRGVTIHLMPFYFKHRRTFKLINLKAQLIIEMLKN